MKKLIRLTEGDLHRIVKESVNIVLKEAYNGGKLTVYHVMNPKYAQEVIHNGFSPAMYRSRTSTYGNGLYCTFTPSPRNKDVYGGCIIKCQTYINNTIFLDLDLAREYAGMSPEMVADDIEKKLGTEAAQRFVELTSNGTMSSYIAFDLLKNGYLDDTFNIAFYSSHDGPVLVVRNPRLVNPLEIIQEGVNNRQ